MASEPGPALHGCQFSEGVPRLRTDTGRLPQGEELLSLLQFMTGLAIGIFIGLLTAVWLEGIHLQIHFSLPEPKAHAYTTAV
jgi:hypothetical protein